MTNFLLAVIPQADPLPLPAPPWLLRLLLVVVFFLHTIAMNFVLGGSLFAALSWRKAADPARLAVRSWMAKLMPTIVALAVTLGVASLLFAQTLYGRVLFTGSVLMGWFWFAVVPLVIAAYYGTYLLAFRHGRIGRSASITVAVLFIAVAFIYVNNMTLMLRPHAFLGIYVADPAGINLNLSDPTVIPRFLHMLLGALAVTGAAIALFGLLLPKDHAAGSPGIMRLGAKWFLAATVLNIAVGTWWFVALPGGIQRAFMGEDGAATASLGIGTLFGLAAFAAMFVAFRAADPSRGIKIALWALGATMLLMVIARDQLREISLRGEGFRMTEWIVPQWDVIAIFLVLFVAGIATTVWMSSLLLRRKTG
jgi:hypothetical protein